MANPVVLVTAAKQEEKTIKDSVVSILQEALTEALADRVDGLVLIVKERDGTYHHRAAYCFTLREEIGALEVIKAERINQARRGTEDE